MRAAVVESPGTVTVREVPDLSLPAADRRATVEIHRAGICGTDVKIFHGAIPTQLPRVLGHELVGTVVRAGAAGTVPIGSRVLLDPSISCGVCPLCRSDRAHLCAGGALMGRDVDGGFAQYVAVDESQLHVLPPSVSDFEAPAVQVLGTCVHGQALVDVFPGQTAAVVGLGVSGLLHVQLLRARGLRNVVGVSRSPGKLELARKLGATAAVTPDEAAATVAEHTGGRGADLVVESAGTVAAFSHAVDLAGIGATLLAFGTITERSGALPFYDLYYKELDIRASRAALPRDYARAVELVASGTISLTPLVTSSFPLGEVAAALAECDSGTGQLKIMLDIG